MATRAKFRCNSLKQCLDNRGQVVAEEVVLNPVYSNEEGSEDRRFWLATPNGSLSMQINNPEAFGVFRPGDECYIDISPAKAVKSLTGD